jgi:hypothetical protein
MEPSLKKINFLIEEDVYQDLALFVPPGKRSKIINQALRRELELIRRKRAVEKIVTASPSKRKFSNREIVEGLGRDRGSH